MDGQRYANHLHEIYQIPTQNITQIFEGLFSAQGELDILQPIITFAVSRFTSFTGILFAVFAIVFGIFQLRSIHMLYEDSKGKMNKNVIILLCFMPLMLPIFSINGFRMWTAAWIFFYGAYNYTYRGKKMYAWVCLSSILVHFSFITLNLVFLAYMLGGNRKWTYTALAIISFTLSEFPLASVEGYIENFGSGITRKFTSYTNTKYTENITEMKAQAAWFIRWSTPLMRYFLAIAIAFIYVRLKKVKISDRFNSLWCLTLLVLTYANLVLPVPSGIRFMSVYYLFAVALLIIFYSQYYKSRKLDTPIILGLFPMILYVLITFRVGFNTVNLTLFMPTPIMAIFTGEGMPLLN